VDAVVEKRRVDDAERQVLPLAREVLSRHQWWGVKANILLSRQKPVAQIP
jgi:hypothetical protein